MSKINKQLNQLEKVLKQQNDIIESAKGLDSLTVAGWIFSFVAGVLAGAVFGYFFL